MASRNIVLKEVDQAASKEPNSMVTSEFPARCCGNLKDNP
jgi:hypothetical protein